jgi:Fic family protein
MQAESFTANSPGHLVDITDERGNAGIAFLPDQMPPKFDAGSKALRVALSHADQELARLDGLARQLEAPETLFRNALNREAILSSKIEGTRTTLGDLALFDIAHRVDNDAEMVANYVEAYNFSRQRCKESGFGVGLLCETHALLMRHTEKGQTTPGQLRERTVVIGTPPPAQARFVPPPAPFVRELMENLAIYLEHDDEPPLIKLAAAHYQFETIHPFCDGNGRVGRIMISSWLHCQDILSAPMLYISAYFQQHQEEYYDKLLRVSTHGEWESWILFFLEAVATQSKDSVIRAKALANLRDDYHARIKNDGGRSHNIYVLLDGLFRTPVMSVPRAVSLSGITYAAAKAHVMKLVDLKILNPEPYNYRGAAYYFADELISTVENNLVTQ